MPAPPPSLKSRALRLLGQREHSRAELERKLGPHEQEPGTLARALDELATAGFINEARVVESLIHQRAPRLGALRLRQELQHKGIAPEAIHEAMAGLRDSELERATAVWRRRFEPPADARERARQIRFLMERGFGAEVVAKVLRQAGADSPEDLDAVNESLTATRGPL